MLTATPVALTVVATVLAGLSSSEMSKAQYHRALAAQDQSKTSDEWAFFQAKKYRATYSTGTAAQLRLQSSRQPFTPAALTALVDRCADDLQSLDSSAGALKEHATPYRQGIRDRVQAFKNVKEPLAKELERSAGPKRLLPVSDRGVCRPGGRNCQGRQRYRGPEQRPRSDQRGLPESV